MATTHGRHRPRPPRGDMHVTGNGNRNTSGHPCSCRSVFNGAYHTPPHFHWFLQPIFGGPCSTVTPFNILMETPSTKLGQPPFHWPNLTKLSTHCILSISLSGLICFSITSIISTGVDFVILLLLLSLKPLQKVTCFSYFLVNKYHHKLPDIHCTTCCNT